VLEAAVPMVSLLWQRETEGRVFDSPERKATLDKALRDKIALIRDPSIRGHYGQEIKDLRWQLFAPQRRAGGGARGKWQAPPAAPHPSTKASMLVAAGDTAAVHMREAVILATLIVTPAVAEAFETPLEAMPCADPEHARLRDAILHSAHDGPDRLRAEISGRLGEGALEKLMGSAHVAITPAVRRPGDAETARMTLAEEFAKLEAHLGLSAEIAEAAEDLSGVADEAVTWRLRQAADAVASANRSHQDDKTEYDIADNGARISRDEKGALDALLDRITFEKGRRS
jgi:DNA primase